MFRFEASPTHQLQRGADIYGTLPHKKKSKSAHVTPASKPIIPPKNSNQSLGNFRRAEGFSRLLEFTRQQQVEMDAAASFDVTQSLPVYTCPTDERQYSLENERIEEDPQTASVGDYDGECTLLHKLENSLAGKEGEHPLMMENETTSSLDNSKLLTVGSVDISECGSESVHEEGEDKSKSTNGGTGVKESLQVNQDHSESTSGSMASMDSLQDESFKVEKSEDRNELPGSDTTASVDKLPDLAKRDTEKDENASPPPVTDLSSAIDDTVVSTMAGTDAESPPGVSSGADLSKQRRSDKPVLTDSDGYWSPGYIALGVGVAGVVLFFAISSYFK